MRALSSYRKEHVRAANTINARPIAHTHFNAQARQVAYSELISWEIDQPQAIQKPDGTFVFMVGYDRLGSGSLG